LTPHKDAVKNPIPLKIIKVAGGTAFEFSFTLHDGLITAKEKKHSTSEIALYTAFRFNTTKIADPIAMVPMQ
jgi:hypothetical protein